MTVELSFDSAFTRLRKVVYKRRLRLKEFLQDFDGLRTGYMHANHFLSGLSMAGMDRELSPKELQLIADAYTVEKTPTLKMVEYRSFLNDVDIIFTLPVRTAHWLPWPRGLQLLD